MFSVEGAKRDAEYKLGSIVSSLRRTIGYGSRSSSGTRLRSRSPSPNVLVVDQYHQQKVLIVMKIVHHLSYDEHHVVHILVHVSPDYDVERARSPGSTYVDVADIDPEQIRSALRDFVQNFITTERERDDCAGKILKRRDKDII